MPDPTHKATITLAGAGLVGSLLAIYLSKRGHRVQVVEKRSDPRKAQRSEGRSINLALSHRGLRALQEANEALAKEILAEAVPMFGREMHDEQGQLSFQPYSAEGHCIYSVSRSRLNNRLIDHAQSQGVVFLFDHHIQQADPVAKQLTVLHEGQTFTLDTPVLCAADGSFSAVRTSLEAQGICQSSMEKIDHGYKELDIPTDRGHLLTPQTALHIWPREAYMLIALPNFDGSYTGTLFLPFQDDVVSFQELSTDQEVEHFFQTHFADAVELFPDVATQYHTNPTSFLANVYTDQWAFGEWLLIGDAAHGIVPFYGQGMNAGFEDCRLLNELLDKYNDQFTFAFQALSHTRKKDTDAIARLAMDNFIEMRDLVADDRFLVQKKIEAALSKALPDDWKTIYSEVTFSDTPYSEALKRGERNQRIMEQVMNETPLDRWQEKAVWEELVEKVKQWSAQK